MMIVMGACALKNSISYVWLFALVPKKDKSICCGCLNAWDTSVLAVVTFYFLLISKNWFYLYFIMSVAGIFAKIFMLVCAPESPMWLL